MNNLSIFAIVISFNPKLDLLTKEYESIVHQVDGIIYIDNNSLNKDAVALWSNNRDKVDLIQLDNNYGIGVAQNAGIKKALDNGATHIIIFDQDSVVNEDFVKTLFEAEENALNSGVNVGITGPIYKSFNDNYLYPIITLKGNNLIEIPYDSFKEYVQVSHVIASGSLIRRQVFEKVGLLNESLFIDFIDFEFCFRARKYGYDTIITKAACMHHMMGDKQILLFGRKIGIYSPFRRYFDARNAILIWRKNLLPTALCKHYIKILFGKILVSFMFGPDRLRQFKYISKGLYDGLRGIDGFCTVH